MRMYDVKIGLQVEAGTQGEAISRAGQVMEAIRELNDMSEYFTGEAHLRGYSFHYDYTTGPATEIHPNP